MARDYIIQGHGVFCIISKQQSIRFHRRSIELPHCWDFCSSCRGLVELETPGPHPQNNYISFCTLSAQSIQICTFRQAKAILSFLITKLQTYKMLLIQLQLLFSRELWANKRCGGSQDRCSQFSHRVYL